MEGITEKLSELRATSDRFGGSRRKAVRTWSNFGQVWRKSQKSCQNPEQLRTGLKEIIERLSESERKMHWFGGKAKTSPNLHTPGRSHIHLLKLKRALQRHNSVENKFIFCCVLRIDVEVAVAEELEFVLRLDVFHVWLDEAVHDF